MVQVIRLLSNFTVKYGDGTLARVPVMYGDPDRQAASIINQNSENTLQSAPRIAVYITDLDLDRSRLSDATYVGKVNVRERDVENGTYNSSQGANYTVERLMPTPFTLSMKVDIWSTSTEQKLQILEQILTFFNPSLEIQSTDNYLDWTSLSVVELEDVTFSSRSVPQGTTISIDIATFTLKSPIWLTPPAKVKKLGVVTNIIANIFGAIDSVDTGYIEGLGTDMAAGSVTVSELLATEKINIGDFDITVAENTVRLSSNDGQGGWINWRVILDQHPGKYTAGLSKIHLYQSDGSEVVGYLSLSPLDEGVMAANWDIDTYHSNDPISGPSRPSTSWGSFDAVIDPTTVGPGHGLAAPTAGIRYLILDSIGGGIIDTFAATTRTKRINTGVEYDKVNSFELFVNGVEVAVASLENEGIFYLVANDVIPVGSTVTYVLNLNEDGPDAWKNTDDSDFIANTNDIIEWNGTKWQIVFSAKESADSLIYQTNLYTLVQYKWNGIAWVKAFDGEYKRGEWRLDL